MSAPTAISADLWLTEVMKRPVFRVNASASQSIDEVARAHAAENAGAFYYGKVPASRADVVRKLCGAGFFVADTNVTFQLTYPSRFTEAVPSRVSVRAFAPGDEDGVLHVASTAFRYTRFHLDPFVDDSIANAIKREWVRNYALGKRGDHLFVGCVDGKPAGFLASLVSGDKAVIDLVGVGTEHQKMSIGRAMTEAFIEQYRSKCAALIVGTQVANTASIRFYEKMGFSLIGSEYVLHKHS